MYITLTDLLNDAAKDDQVRVVLWHGAGDSCSGLTNSEMSIFENMRNRQEIKT